MVGGSSGERRAAGEQVARGRTAAAAWGLPPLIRCNLAHFPRNPCCSCACICSLLCLPPPSCAHSAAFGHFHPSCICNASDVAALLCCHHWYWRSRQPQRQVQAFVHKPPEPCCPGLMVRKLLSTSPCTFASYARTWRVQGICEQGSWSHCCLRKHCSHCRCHSNTCSCPVGVC